MSRPLISFTTSEMQSILDDLCNIQPRDKNLQLLIDYIQSIVKDCIGNTL